MTRATPAAFTRRARSSAVVRPDCTHPSATATGSPEYSVTRAASPWRRRTHFPPLRSIAGMTSNMALTIKTKEPSGLLPPRLGIELGQPQRNTHTKGDYHETRSFVHG